jgi:hypothetical protein
MIFQEEKKVKTNSKINSLVERKGKAMRGKGRGRDV